MATTRLLLLQFGDGAAAEEFQHSCTINTSQDFTLEATTTDGTEPNCGNPNAPNWVLRAVDTLSANINGAGTADPVSYGVLRTKMLTGEDFKVRVLLDGLSAVQGGGYFEGSYVMTSLGLAKEGKGYLTSSVALASTGEVKWVPAT